MATGAQGGVLGVVTSAEQECCAAVPLAPSPFFNAWLAMRDFERKMSQLCIDNDLTVTLRSCDGVLFEVERSGMAANFLADRDTSPVREVIDARESSAVLRLLLQYTNGHAPLDLAALDFNDLLALGEAVHKYRMSAAILDVSGAMREAIPEHPFEVLNWAMKYEHVSLMDEAAERAVDFSPDSITCDSVPVAWLKYYSRWQNLAALAYRPIAWPMHYSPEKNVCDQFRRYYTLFACQLGGRPGQLRCHDLGMPKVDHSQDGCTSCKASVLQWTSSLLKVRDGLPKFSTFI